MDDKDLFAAEMLGVKPIKVQQKAVLQKNKVDDERAKLARRLATQEDEEDSNALGVDHLEMVEPNAYLEFHRTGMQHGVLKNLRLGKYAIEAKLDLHHRTVEQARRDVFEFIQDCMKYDLRTVVISHGKGERSEPKALLKSQVNRWLPQLPEVNAFYSCQPKHGGAGAVYVLLKKSAEKKLENREHHLKGRS